MISIDNNLYIKDIGTYIDPFFPVERAIITHGHADHARAGHKHVLCTPETSEIMKIRYGENCANSFQTIQYGQSVNIGKIKVTLYPAAHILGSAQVLLETSKQRVVITGDYKTTLDRHLDPFEIVPCDLLITEATFGLPVFKFNKPELEIGRLLDNISKNRENTFLIGAYSLGKAQRIIWLLREAGVSEDIFVHGSMEKLCEFYQSKGINLGALRKATLENKKDFNGKIVLAPPSALKDRWSRRFENITRCYASGWMQVKQRAKQSQIEIPIVISDHSDWNELTDTIKQTGAEKVWITHGREDALKYWCDKNGIQAEPLSLQHRDEASEL